jgi:hypothetical protein
MFLNSAGKLGHHFHIDSKQLIALLNIAVLFACLVVVGLTVFGGGKGKVTLQRGGDTMTIDLESADGPRALIEKLFEDKANIRITMSILSKLKDIYPIDGDLVNRIRQEDASSDFSRGLRDMLASFQGPFEREAHSFRDITEAPTADDILNLKRDLPVAQRLRSYARRMKGIFNPPAVTVLVARSATVAANEAAVCADADYRDSYIQLLNKKNPQFQVSVMADRSFACDGAFVKPNTVRISGSRWAELFGNTPSAEPENGLLLPGIAGYQPALETGTK